MLQKQTTKAKWVVHPTNIRQHFTPRHTKGQFVLCLNALVHFPLCMHVQVEELLSC